MTPGFTLDLSTEWIIIVPPNIPQAEKGVEDLARCIGLLAAPDGAAVPPKVVNAFDTIPSGAPSGEVSFIVLNCEDAGPERNGFEWRAGPDRVEIFGESSRGLCNGIYSFFAALGISWPAPWAPEKLPPIGLGEAHGFSLASAGACEPSHYEEGTLNPARVPWRRFVPTDKRAINNILKMDLTGGKKRTKAFAAWAARNRYDALVFPLAAFASASARRKLMSLKTSAESYGIALEAGGHDLSSLVPRGYFFFHRDFFRLKDGKRVRDHHFCPTNPGTIRLIGKTGEKLFSAAEGVKVFHLWPDREADTAWCSCPSCRAFTAQEQNRIAVNAAADVLAVLNPGAVIVFYEKPGEEGKIPLRKNTFRIEKLPD